MRIIDELGIDIDFPEKIKINYDKLGSLSDCLVELKHTHKRFEWINDDYWPSKNESNDLVSQFFTFGNSINFKYWTKNGSSLEYCSGEKNGIHARGAMYMWRCLKVCYDSQTIDILNSQRLSKIKFEEFRKFFQDDSGNDVLPSLKTRYENWMDLSSKLIKQWDGKIINLVQSCNSSLVKFTNLLKNFRAFDDPISKMIMVNAIMHQGRGIIQFEQPIIPGIDYQILKQLLRQGVIIPDQNIVEKLKKYDLLEDSEALDLRKATLTALYRVMEKSGLSGDYIDNMIWGNRTKCEEEDPVCEISKETECPFHKFCDKKTDLLIPLEETRYY